MSKVEQQLEDLKATITSELPSDISVSDVKYEGPELVVYTRDPKKFARNGDLIRKLASQLRKRITVRPDPDVLSRPDTAREDILERHSRRSGRDGPRFPRRYRRSRHPGRETRHGHRQTRQYAPRDNPRSRLDAGSRQNAAHRVLDGLQRQELPETGTRGPPRHSRAGRQTDTPRGDEQRGVGPYHDARLLPRSRTRELHPLDARNPYPHRLRRQTGVGRRAVPPSRGSARRGCRDHRRRGSHARSLGPQRAHPAPVQVRLRRPDLHDRTDP